MEFYSQEELIDALHNAILASIQNTGNDIFELMQQYTPVRTGVLKKSESLENTSSGIELKVDAPYAARVEAGGPAIPFKGVFRNKVKAHTKSTGTKIRSYTRIYKDQKPVTFKINTGESITRVLKEVPAQEGRFFLARSINEGLPNLVHNMGKTLKELEK